MGQFALGRPGQQAAAEREPQRSVCRSKAIKQHHAIIVNVDALMIN